MAQPFVDWLASYPKSGNTWVRSLLDAYRYQDKFHLNTMDTVSSEPKIATYLGMWNTTDEYGLYDWAAMRAPALRQYYESHRTNEHFVLKTHCANVYMSDIPLISSVYTRKAVYVVRDPRDVLVSSAKYFRNDFDTQWKLMRADDHMLGTWDHKLTFQPCASWRMNVLSWLTDPKFPVLRVRYEDLLSDTAAAFTAILEFYGIEVDQIKVVRAVELTSFDRMQKAEKDHGFNDNLPQEERPEKGEACPFFRSGTSGQWKQSLTEELADEVYQEYRDIESIWGTTP